MAELKPNVSATTAPAAADESVLSVVVEALLVVAHALWRVRWASALSSLARLLAWPLALVLRPLSYAASVVLFLFGPAIHVLSFFLACAAAVVAFVASLEPLYTFFSVAAVIGIASGVTLALCSSAITSYLGMCDEPPSYQRLPAKGMDPDLELPPASLDAEWYWTESSPARRRQPSGLLSQTIHEEDDSEP